MTGTAWIYYRSWVAVILLIPAGVWYYIQLLDECIKRKEQEFLVQFKELIQTFSSLLNTGYSVENAVKESLKEMQIFYSDDAAILRELEIMVRQIRVQVPVEQAVEELSERTKLPDVESFAGVFVTAKRSGGNLMSIIRNTADQIGDKIDVKREIDTMLAAKKYEFQVMSVIPFWNCTLYDCQFSGIYGKSLRKYSRKRSDDRMSDHIFGRIRAWAKDHRDRSLSIGIMLVVFSVGVAALIWDYNGAYRKNVEEITRKTYGKGKRTEELRVEGKDRVLGEIPIEVTEQVYGEQEISQVLKQAVKKMDSLILGENVSLDHVDRDLNLLTEIPGKPIDVTWKLDRYDVINIYGKLKEDKLVSEGTPVKLTAILTYREDVEKQILYECMAMVYPRMTGSDGALLEKVRRTVAEKDQDTRESGTLTLPKQVDGQEIHFYTVMNWRGAVIMAAAVVISVLFFALDKQNEIKEKQARQKQMCLDYPEVISKLTLLLGAGMTVRKAWIKIVNDYDSRIKQQGKRAVYEEMKYTCRQMDGGVPEAECYEKFGRRCGTQEYMRFGALLSQNLRKGTKGLNDLLRLEAIQSFEERKARARRLGEEAGTKLLLPMFLMLAEVLVIVVVPAFFTVQM